MLVQRLAVNQTLRLSASSLFSAVEIIFYGPTWPSIRFTLWGRQVVEHWSPHNVRYVEFMDDPLGRFPNGYNKLD